MWELGGMSSFIIERCRSLCEETEVLEKMVVMLFGKLPRDSVTSLVIETAIKQLGKLDIWVAGFSQEPWIDV